MASAVHRVAFAAGSIDLLVVACKGHSERALYLINGAVQQQPDVRADLLSHREHILHLIDKRMLETVAQGLGADELQPQSDAVLRQDLGDPVGRRGRQRSSRIESSGREQARRVAAIPSSIRPLRRAPYPYPLAVQGT